METYTCTKYIDLEVLRRLLTSSKVADQVKVKFEGIAKRVKKKGRHQVTFKPRQRIHRSKGVGRLYPNVQSLQGLPRDVRKALAHKTHSDVDVKNCHPELLDPLPLWLSPRPRCALMETRF